MLRLTFALTLALLIPVLADAQAPVARDVEIFYTGRLLGYFRVPDLQVPGNNSCAEPATGNAAVFIKQVNAFRKGQLLLGTGDNLAPELFSRVAGPPPVRALKQQFPAGATNIDNVACFLSRAGYDAVVPGKYEFYFGPEYLRQTAFTLAVMNAPVQMLAVNLGMESSMVDPADRIPAKERKLGFIAGAPPNITVKMPGKVTPWMRHFEIKDLESTARIYFCRERGTGRDPYDIDLPAGNHCVALTQSATGTEVSLINRESKDTLLQPNTNNAICITTTGSATPYCTLFQVVMPFFQSLSGQPIQEPSNFTAVDAMKPTPFLLKTLASKTDVAVFGAVEPNFEQYVGGEHLSWDKGGRDYVTAATVLDPVQALDELNQYFEEYYRAKTKNRFRGIKVLLAQGSPEVAAEIGVATGTMFQTIVSMADKDYATANFSRTMTVERTSSNRDLLPPPFVAVPEPPFTLAADKPADRLHLEVHRLHLQETGPETWMLDTSRIEQAALDNKPNLLLTDSQFNESLEAALKRFGAVESCSNVDAVKFEACAIPNVQLLTLALMRKELGTEVAMLQQRDWFPATIGDPATRLNLQDNVDRLVWKGDMVIRMHLRGSALKSIMEKSGEYDDQDGASIQDGHQSRRGIVPLGIEEKSGKYFIAGEEVSDDALYSVAISDFMAAGDTGYSQFSKAVGESVRSDTHRERRYISSLLCDAMWNPLKDAPAGPASCRPSNPVQNAGIPGTSRIQFPRPFDMTAGNTNERQFLGWLKDWAPHRVEPRDDSVEGRAQHERGWTIDLSKLTFGIDKLDVRGDTDRFAGITDPSELSSKPSRHSSIEGSLRTEYSIFFAQYDVKSTYERNGSETSRPDNAQSLESGLLYRRKYKDRSYGFFLSAREETQISKPVLDELTLADEKSKIPALPLNFRTPSLLARTGTRFENGDSFLETGFEFGRRRNIVTAYQFLGTDVMCTLGATKATSLAQCVEDHSGGANPTLTSSSMYAPLTVSKNFQGIFLNFKFAVPVPWVTGFTYTMENKGNWFLRRPTDLPVETRRLDTWTNNISYDVLENLKVTAGMEYTYYQNKVDMASLLHITPRFGIDFSFSKKPRVGWKKVLAHKTK